MGTERLVVDFERRGEGGVVLRVSGRLVGATAAVLDGVLGAVRADESDVVLDLTGVEHIDARGLDLLLALESDRPAERASIEIVGVSESLRERRPGDR